MVVSRAKTLAVYETGFHVSGTVEVVAGSAANAPYRTLSPFWGGELEPPTRSLPTAAKR